jgi:hypothetical protein
LVAEVTALVASDAVFSDLEDSAVEEVSEVQDRPPEFDSEAAAEFVLPPVAMRFRLA